MKEYYIIKEDGTSLFEQAYCEDFVFHCLIQLIDRTPAVRYRLCEIGSIKTMFFSLSAFPSPMVSD